MTKTVFLAGLPRSFTLGIADLLAQQIAADKDDQQVILTGHSHLAAALSEVDLSCFDSPLHLYQSNEALTRMLLQLQKIPLTLDTYVSVQSYFFKKNSGLVDRKRLLDLVEHSGQIMIDPSFSHALRPEYLINLPLSASDCHLLVIWRNPISFGLDIMKGVFALDACLHWMLDKADLGFPLDPLKLWLEFVDAYSQFLGPSSSIKMSTSALALENIMADGFRALSKSFPLVCQSQQRPSSLKVLPSLLTECPYSGDPSYDFSSNSSSTDVSIQQLSHLSSSEHVIQRVINSAKLIGYSIVD